MEKNMSSEDKKGFRDTLLDGLAEVIAKTLNTYLREALPRFLNWVTRVGEEKCIEFIRNYGDAKVKQLSVAENGNFNSIIKTDSTFEKQKHCTNDQESLTRQIETIYAEIADNTLMWELLKLFVQEVECPYCSEIISENWFDSICDEFSSERNMGTETIYSIECDDFQCPKCKKVFKVDGIIEAYPDGIYNYHDLKTTII
jgi:hypothetical protein